MGKLVLFLEDGRVKPILLGKDRLVVGRRVDNDVCLPYPAVSSEHAAIVTILHDSFLEDLGSTNGTLVNGKAITKHFLRDRDEIDIGRQRLVYLADDSTEIEGRTVEMARDSARLVGEQVARAEPALSERRAFGAEPKAPPSGERRGSVTAAAEATAAVPLPVPVPAPVSVPVPPAMPRQLAATKQAVAARPKLPGQHPTSSASGGNQVDTFVEELVRMGKTPLPVSQESGPEGRITVLSGPNAGRSVIVVGKDVTVGRVGYGVALIRHTPDGYRLLPSLGEAAPTFGGAVVPVEGALLKGGEIFEVAGARLEFVAPVRVGGP